MNTYRPGRVRNLWFVAAMSTIGQYLTSLFTRMRTESPNAAHTGKHFSEIASSITYLHEASQPHNPLPETSARA